MNLESQERNKFRARRSKRTQSLKIPLKRSLYLMRSSHTSLSTSTGLANLIHPVNFSAREGYKGYKDGLQPESPADGNWLVKQNQPVSKIETKSDTNLRSLYES